MENLRLCKRMKGFLLYAWFLGYNHFHLMVQPNDEWNISDVMQFLKRHVSLNLNIVMGYTMGMFESNDDDHLPIEGDIGQCRLQVFGVLRHNHHWPYIQKFDQYVQKLKNQFQQKYQNNHPYPKFQWKESFHDHYIRSNRDFDEHMEYIAYNPFKHKMPNDCLHAEASAKAWVYVYTNPKYDDLIDECL